MKIYLHRHNIRLDSEANDRLNQLCSQLGMSKGSWMRHEIEKALNQDKVLTEKNELIARILEELRVYKDQVRKIESEQINLSGAALLILLEQKFGSSANWTELERGDITDYIDRIGYSAELIGSRFFESSVRVKK